MVYTSKIRIQTAKRTEAADITNLVEAVLLESKIHEGLLTVFCGHTSASVFMGIADERVPEDFIDFTSDLIPNKPDFKHNIYGGRNADSHLKSILTGNSITIPVTDGKISLGQWQAIFLAEFCGPRERKIMVKIMGEKID